MNFWRFTMCFESFDVRLLSLLKESVGMVSNDLDFAWFRPNYVEAT